MSSSLFARALAIIPVAAAATLAGKEGTLFKRDAANKAIVIAAATDVPAGVIGAVTNDGLEISALISGGNHGTVKIKLGAAVTDLRKDLQLRADGTVGPDVGTGTARVIVARPLETGAVGELIECVLLYPVTLA